MLKTAGAPPLAKRAEDTFTATGFDNRKKAGEKFLTHSRSQLHLEALMRWQLEHQPGIDAVIDQIHKADQKRHGTCC